MRVVKGEAAEGWDAGATAEAVKKAFEILLEEKAVKSIFVNVRIVSRWKWSEADAVRQIFGGMCADLSCPPLPFFSDSSPFAA